MEPIRKYCITCGQTLSLRNIDGREQLVCSQCGLVVYRNPIPATCVVVIEDGKVLIVKRAVEPRKGKWCLPGGFIEIDETAKESALRELTEETGLDGEIISLIDVSHQLRTAYDNVLLVGYTARIIGGEMQAGDDAAECAFIDLDSRPRLAFSSHEYFLKKVLSESR